MQSHLSMKHHECRNSILVTSHYPDLGSTFEWLWREGNLPPAIKSTTQIWEVTLHEYGISTVAPQMSFTGKPVMVSLMSAVSMAIIFIAF